MSESDEYALTVDGKKILHRRNLLEGWHWLAVQSHNTILGFYRVPFHAAVVKVEERGAGIPVWAEMARHALAVDDKRHIIMVRLYNRGRSAELEVVLDSDDRDIEFWRKIKGFLEVKGHDE